MLSSAFYPLELYQVGPGIASLLGPRPRFSSVADFEALLSRCRNTINTIWYLHCFHAELNCAPAVMELLGNLTQATGDSFHHSPRIRRRNMTGLPVVACEACRISLDGLCNVSSEGSDTPIRALRCESASKDSAPGISGHRLTETPANIVGGRDQTSNGTSNASSTSSLDGVSSKYPSGTLPTRGSLAASYVAQNK